MESNPDEPYNELPDILPDEMYWRLLSVYEQANKANRALAELKGRLSSIPNPDIFINTLSLQEAKDSSSIENVFTTNDKLFKAFTLSSTADPHTKEVLRYGKALVDGFRVIKSGNSFSVELIELIEGWILFMLTAIEETSKYTLDKVLTIIDLFNDTKEKMQGEVPDIYSFELLEILFMQVYCKYAFLVERGIASRNTASKYLNRLVDFGILEKEKVGNEFIFKNKGLYEILGK